MVSGSRNFNLITNLAPPEIYSRLPNTNFEPQVDFHVPFHDCRLPKLILNPSMGLSRFTFAVSRLPIAFRNIATALALSLVLWPMAGFMCI
jgi:hypothetical protein